MSLLPSSSAGFTDPQYWKQFFANRKTPFEWYGSLDTLGAPIEKYVKIHDKILQIGCGNSELASQLHDIGHRGIHSIDVDGNVIAQQKQKNKERPDLTFEQCDATNLRGEDEKYNVVLDKGTYDALLPPTASDTDKKVVERMFDEVDRVLIPGGRYLIVTLAQEHLVNFWLDYFIPTNLYLIRVQKVENSASGFHMPVFVFIAQKMLVRMTAPMPMQFQGSGCTKSCKPKTAKDVKELIKSEQELSQFISSCGNLLEYEEAITFAGENPELGPQYKIFVVDNLKNVDAHTLTYGAFIVPTEREGEWLYATTKGRRFLREQCKMDRLVVVLLNRKREYPNFDAIKAEIGHFLTQIDRRPKALNSEFPIMTLGETPKTIIATGTSMYCGEWVVEEIITEQQEHSRRLMFLDSLNLIQSEAYMKKKKNSKKRYVDLDHIVSDFHIMMLAGLALSPREPLFKKDVSMRMAVLGLGGGLLTAFLARNFKKSHVTGVEIDPEVVKIANEHFSFPHSDANVEVKVMNALTFVKEIAERDMEEEKYDVIFVDVADNQDRSMHCPPPAFVTDHALENMKNSLTKDGILCINMVTRDDEVSMRVKNDVSKFFKWISVIGSDVDVNEVLFCQHQKPVEKMVPTSLSNRVKRDIFGYDGISKAVRRLQIGDMHHIKRASP